MKVGAPRTVCPSDEDLIKLGEELVEWATEKTGKNDKRIHLTQWWSLKHAFTKDAWDSMCDKPVFIPYYKRAKQAIALRYIDGTINSSIAHRFMRHYFPEVELKENEQARFEAELKKMNLDEAKEILIKVIDYSKGKKDAEATPEKDA